MDIAHIETIRNAIGKQKIAILAEIFRSCEGTPPGVPAAPYRMQNREWSDLLQQLASEQFFLQLNNTADKYQLRTYALPVIGETRAQALLVLIDALFAKLKELCPRHSGEMTSTSLMAEGIAGDPDEIREALFYLADIGSGAIWSGLSANFPYGADPKMNISESVLRYENFGSVLYEFYERHFLRKQERAKMLVADRSSSTLAETQNATHLFSAERAIESVQEDLLDRVGFSRAIADAIQGWPGEDSLVIALTGEWGSGKSSIKNMAIEILKRVSDHAPQIVEFNPWQWAGQQKLHQAFFSELSIAIGKVASNRATRRKAARWRFYGNALGVGSTLLTGLSGLMSWVLLALAALGMLSVWVNQGWFQNLVFFAMLTVFVATGVAKWGGQLSKKMSQLYEAYAGLTRKTLTELKAELKNDLRGLERLVLVVCDDIDRLDASQTRLLFQLIKANADFPNIVYLLAFQRDIVESHLSTDGISGRDYLEKIVQVSFNIPTIERSRLEHVLFTRLDKILEEDSQITKRFNQERWGNIYYAGLHRYFLTLRDVYRFLSTFAFHVSLFRGKRAFEVNPIDLIALEVLRVFEPELYGGIARSRELLTTELSPAREDRNATGSAIQALIDLASKENREEVKHVMTDLFPNVGRIFGAAVHGPEQYNEWYQDLRVCHKDVFDRYFLLAISSRDLSQSELDEIILLSSNKDKLVAKLEELRSRNLLDVAFDRLDVYKQKIPIENAVSFVSAIFDVGDTLRRDHVLLTELDPHTHAWRIVSWYLKQEPNSERRADILLEALERSHGLTILIALLHLEEERRGKATPSPEDFLVPDEKLSQLKERCLAKIRDSAASVDGRLAKNPKLATLLYRWSDWGDSSEVRTWVASLIKSPDGLIAFLVSFTGMSTSQRWGSRVARMKWSINLTEIEKFASLEELANEVAKLDVTTLTEEQKRAADAFKRAKTRRDAGKRDTDLFELDDE